jgi:hypothetical protein
VDEMSNVPSGSTPPQLPPVAVLLERCCAIAAPVAMPMSGLPSHLEVLEAKLSLAIEPL